MKNKKTIITLILVVAVVAYIANQIYISVKALSAHSAKFEKTSPADYMSLFNENAILKMNLQSSVSYDTRNTLSYFLYDSRYDIEVTKINVNRQFDIKNDIIENFQNPEGNLPQVYMPYHEDNLDIFYNGNSMKSTSKLYISLFGDSTKVLLKNDSVVCYSLRTKKGAIQYKSKDIYEIFWEVKNTWSVFLKEKQVNLVLIKRNNSLYYLFLCPLDDSEKLDPLLLYRLTKKNI